MVLLDARAELREALAALIAGQLSTDGFTEVYYRLCEGSPDRAVEAVGQFGWGLYSDMELYYLTGWHEVSAETRGVAERCDLFLRSRLEYEWPPYPGLGWVQFAKVVVTVVVSLVLLLVAMLLLLALANGAWGGAGVIALIAILAAMPVLWVCRWLGRHAEARRSSYWSCGPRELWPFFSEAEYQQASGGAT
jgi:hypothetical protein